MNTDAQIGNIVANDYRSASVFRKYGIDFCCGGGKTIEAVCEKKGIDIQNILSDLNKIEQDTPTGTDYKNWDLDSLSKHIIDKHHAYTRNTISDLNHYLTKVVKVHSDHNPELILIKENFDAMAAELMLHMQKEEMVLFPYIREIGKCKESEATLTPPPFGRIENPIRMMESEHDTAGDHLKEIRKHSNDFTPPEYACNTFMVTYNVLKEFETDLHEHIHLENNILFPKAIELEKELLQLS